MAQYHVPVLLSEVIAGLKVTAGKRFIDCTFGGGGHTQKILSAGGEVLAIDQDKEAVEEGEANFRSQIAGSKLVLRQGNFANLSEIAERAGFTKVDGVLFDLGVSGHQLETDYRGFSFLREAELDMRMDREAAIPKALDLVNGLTEKELTALFTKYGEEPKAALFARAIVRVRREHPITTTTELTGIILALRRRKGFKRIHPATRVFQALRMAVNDELNNLKSALPQAVNLLVPGGRLIVVSFQSLEDREVKSFFKRENHLAVMTEKPVTPGEEEIKENPRARSAKLRMAEKI